MNIHDDLSLIERIISGDQISAHSSRVGDAWRRIKEAARTNDASSRPAFPSFMGFMIAIDASLAEGVIEFRDNTGKVLGTFNGKKRE